MVKFLRSNRSFLWIVLVLITVGALTAACASLPPTKSVTDLSQIAGKWQGTGYGPAGGVPVTQTINADGSYSAALPSGTFTGKIAISVPVPSAP